MIRVEIADEQTALTIDAARLQQAAEKILAAYGYRHAEISIALVDDATVRELHRRFMSIDEPTDVLTFPLEHDADRLGGEVVVSADTARRVASELRWPAEDELFLYVVHGLLHLVGLDDIAADDRQAMRREERRWLAEFGLQPPHVSDR